MIQPLDEIPPAPTKFFKSITPEPGYLTFQVSTDTGGHCIRVATHDLIQWQHGTKIDVLGLSKFYADLLATGFQRNNWAPYGDCKDLRPFIDHAKKPEPKPAEVLSPVDALASFLVSQVENDDLLKLHVLLSKCEPEIEDTEARSPGSFLHSELHRAIEKALLRAAESLTKD